MEKYLQMLLEMLVEYRQTGRVRCWCAICGKPAGYLPQKSTPSTSVKVYHWACLAKEHGLTIV